MKKMSSSAKYLIGEGLKNVKNNKLMSFASTGVLSACLLMIGFAILLTTNLDRMVGFIGEQSSVAIFLKDDANQSDINKLKSDLEKDDNVKEIKFVSKEEALKEYTQRLSNKEVADTLKENNILPSSFEVSLYDLNEIDKIEQIANKSKAFDSFTAPTNIASTITSLKTTIVWFGVFTVLILIIISLVIISNTIRASVFARRKEIEIMKQVGATKSFIRLPFLIEGMAIGVMSSIISFIILGTGYEIVKGVLTNGNSTFLQSMFSSLIPFWFIGIFLAIGFLLGGVLAGISGSALSLRKHLKN